LPENWRIVLDPLLLNTGPRGNGFYHSAEYLNQLVISYTPDILANRAFVVIGAAACLIFLWLRFSINELSKQAEDQSGHTPIEITPYLLVNVVILVPSAIFLSAVSVFLNVLLRNKYSAYMISIGLAAGLYYLYSVGYNSVIYNPLLYQLWQYEDLGEGWILWHRLCCLAIASICLALAVALFERRRRRSVVVDS
jgi:hypothetical protein